MSKISEVKTWIGRGSLNASQVTGDRDIELGGNRLQPLLVPLFFQETHCCGVSLES